MIPRPNRPDPARLIADLGIQPRPQPNVEEVLAALADLKEARHRVLGIPRTPPKPLTEAERQELLDGLATLAAAARTSWWEKP